MPAGDKRCSAQATALRNGAAKESDSSGELSDFTDTVSPEKSKSRQGPAPSSPLDSKEAAASGHLQSELSESPIARSPSRERSPTTPAQSREAQEREEVALIRKQLQKLTVGALVDRHKEVHLMKLMIEEELTSRSHPLMPQKSHKQQEQREATPEKPPKHSKEEPAVAKEEATRWWDDWKSEAELEEQGAWQGHRAKGQGKRNRLYKKKKANLQAAAGKHPWRR